MNRPNVSVVVVSHERPDDLQICLNGLKQLYYPSFEIVVVADNASAGQVVEGTGVTVVAFDGANIAAARNLGVAAAAGEIIAFIDDDAVPEPTWLDHLTGPFDREEVGAAGGYVIGRNGISLQWGAQAVDASGWDHPIRVRGDEPELLLADQNNRAIRTQGTNMAFRRRVLADLGGFDPAFTFFHDETDLNMRIAAAGHLTAVVPRARVHHRSSVSGRRRSDRVPTSLFDIGASSAVFHRKYLRESDWAQAREDLVESQFRRLEGMLIDGRVEPKNFETLLRSLHGGYNDGLARKNGEFQNIAPQSRAFEAYPGQPARHETLSGRFGARRGLRAQAEKLVAEGAVVTLVLLDPTARYHRHRFTKAGYWEQTGGVFGKSDRTGPLLQMMGRDRRAEAELQRIACFRNPD